MFLWVQSRRKKPFVNSPIGWLRLFCIIYVFISKEIQTLNQISKAHKDATENCDILLYRITIAFEI